MSDPSSPGAQLAARRVQHPGVCELCGAAFTGLKKKRYCSKACGVLAWQAAHPDAVKRARATTYRNRVAAAKNSSETRS